MYLTATDNRSVVTVFFCWCRFIQVDLWKHTNVANYHVSVEWTHCSAALSTAQLTPFIRLIPRIILSILPPRNSSRPAALHYFTPYQCTLCCWVSYPCHGKIIHFLLHHYYPSHNPCAYSPHAPSECHTGLIHRSAAKKHCETDKYRILLPLPLIRPALCVTLHWWHQPEECCVSGPVA